MSRRQTYRPAPAPTADRIRHAAMLALAGVIVALSYSLGSVVRLILTGS